MKRKDCHQQAGHKNPNGTNLQFLILPGQVPHQLPVGVAVFSAEKKVHPKFGLLPVEPNDQVKAAVIQFL